MSMTLKRFCLAFFIGLTVLTASSAVNKSEAISTPWGEYHLGDGLRAVKHHVVDPVLKEGKHALIAAGDFIGVDTRPLAAGLQGAYNRTTGHIGDTFRSIERGDILDALLNGIRVGWDIVCFACNTVYYAKLYLRDQREIAACQVEQFKERYCGCFACSTVSVMVSLFLKVAALGTPLVQKFAQAILLIFTALWIAIYFLKQLSSLSAIDLSETVQTLAFFLFKVLVCWVAINGGFALASYYILDPIISFGSDFGIQYLDMVSSDTGVDFNCGSKAGGG